jgi:hypothetical protein
MLLLIISRLFKTESRVPEEYLRMVRAEYRAVPEDYIEFFLKKNNRLPTTEELYNVI